VVIGQRGYFGVGIIDGKCSENVGTLWRSAANFGAAFIFTVGNRYKRQPTDTVATYRHVPYWRFDDWIDCHAHLPYDCQLIGVEIADRAISLETFTHPERAVYLLGPEDGSIPDDILAKCSHVLRIQSVFCLNVAVAGSVVMYDRQTKQLERKQW
jgi:tRNA G18 (ribose-2'-O)-methylase SpoU